MHATEEWLRDNINRMRCLALNADELIVRLLYVSRREPVCILDSSGVGHLGSHLLIAGIRPVKQFESSGEPNEILAKFDELATDTACAGVFTLSYDLGRKMLGIGERINTAEPDLFFSTFDVLVVHDYSEGRSFMTGNGDRFDEIEKMLAAGGIATTKSGSICEPSSNFDRENYCRTIETIKEHIRGGYTYQTNLTQKFAVELAEGDAAEDILLRLRKEHPAPFAAFIKRRDSTVVSASPERFFRISRKGSSFRLEASPIKGTRRRGIDKREDDLLRNELIVSAKDRAENTMIVDLLRNDLGRVCRFGSVKVERLCELEEHPTLFHLVSTISGELREGIRPSDILQALFPCGSITGAPKISTMRIIDELEPDPRGLFMGTVGISIPDGAFEGLEPGIDTSVAIRTMVICEGIAEFNVGGGIVIDSDPAAEYEESLLKAKALLNALGR